MSTRKEKKGRTVRITGTEKLLIALAAAFVLFASGYFLGRNSALSDVTVQSTAGLLAAPSAAQQAEEQPDSPALQPADAADAPASSAPQQRVNINTADAALLDTLPGIGTVLAGRIIADREENGPYEAVEDITRVPGIGEKILENLYDLITVG